MDQHTKTQLDRREQVSGSPGIPMPSPAFAAFLLALLGLAVVMSGCGASGPALGTVSGQVRLNGQPLPYALIVFEPAEQAGTYGSGYADQDGRYQLQFSRRRKGALVGRHLVRITTPDSDALDKGQRAPKKDKLPVKYNAKSDLFRDVVAGHNTFDFDLKSPDAPLRASL
ncbi:MAG TPA: hypothetical protein VM510_06400 [Caulifigura sp.]|jgi:hypothetical protein|nr:hypothetical protein [Caulifigura sp.]